MMDELKINFDAPLSIAKTVGQKSIEDCGLDLLGKSKLLAPIDKGDLRGSGSMESGNLEVYVGFNTPYAVRQHEHTEYNHPQGGQAKYLEEPYNDNVDKYINHVADALRNAFK